MTRKKPGFIKKTITGLIMTALAALPSCVKTDTEYVDVHHWQTPISNLHVISEDGKKAALGVMENTDLETYLYDADTETKINLSNDPEYSDYPVAFAENYLITRATSQDGDKSKLKVYDTATKEITFETTESRFVHDFIVSPDKTRLVYFHEDNLYVHTIGTDTTEQLIPGAENSHIQRTSNDKKIAFIDSWNPNSGTTVSILDMTDGNVTPILNLYGHSVEEISADNSKAILQQWTDDEDTKKVDIASKTIEIINLPTGKEVDWIRNISDNGQTLIAELQNIGDYKDQYWTYNLTTNTWQFITNQSTDLGPDDEEDFHYEGISPDGNIIAFWYEHEMPSSVEYGIRFYNNQTQEIYDPLSEITDKHVAEIEGFTPLGSSHSKIVIRYDTTSDSDYHFVLHDPETKTNTILGETGYTNEYGSEITADRKYFAINAEEDAGGYNAVILEDLVNGTKDIIKKPGVHLYHARKNFAQENDEYIFLEGIDSTSTNLFAYNLQTKTLTQITQHADNRIRYFNLSSQADDNSRIFFEERYPNGTKSLLEYEFASGDLDVVSN